MLRLILSMFVLLASAASAIAADAVSFRNEVLPLLARQGCSSASCHGSPRGKGELQLSLWGLDVESDYRNLVEKDAGQRIDKSDPEGSKVLAKPSRNLPHKGGLRLPEKSEGYALLKKWIAAGCVDDKDAPTCVKIQVQPAPPLKMKLADAPQPLKIAAVFSDNSTRDVSHLAVFSSTNESIATVTADGVIMPWSRGLAAINVRYQQQLETVFVTITDDVPGFIWSAPPPANYIDELVYRQLQELQILPAKLCSDEAFVRRVHLDVVGVLPEPAAVRAFLADGAPDKRAKLIDDLLSRPEHAKSWAQRWGDLLQIRKQAMGNSSLDYARWIEEAWTKNLPYDQFVAQLVTATGPTAQEPKANFYRMGSDHFETMEAAAVVLLGARIQCAKCHNHPQEKWTQSDYHGLRHFFHRVTVEVKKDVAEVRLAADMEVKMPDSNKVVAPWLPGAGAVTLKKDEDPRAHLARWLGEKDNPYLARVEANRIWAYLMGRGIIEPYDDVRETNPPLNPPLLDALTRDFREHGHDRRHLLRTILRSNTYQASVAPAVATASAGQNTAANADDFAKVLQPFFAKNCNACHGADNPKGGLNLAALAGSVKQPAEATAWTKVFRSLTQGHMPPEGETQPTAAERRRVASWIRASLGSEGHAAQEETFFATYRPRRLRAEQLLDAICHLTGVPESFGRATGLLVPDQNQHEFLQAFGQPQRGNTCSCDRPTDGNLSEALLLYNGKLIQDKLKNSSTRFRKAIRDKKPDAAIIEDMFLAAYSRAPSAEELAAAQKFLAGRPNREAAYEDLCWALMTTNEFLSQH